MATIATNKNSSLVYKFDARAVFCFGWEVFDGYSLCGYQIETIRMRFFNFLTENV